MSNATDPGAWAGSRRQTALKSTPPGAAAGRAGTSGCRSGSSRCRFPQRSPAAPDAQTKDLGADTFTVTGLSSHSSPGLDAHGSRRRTKLDDVAILDGTASRVRAGNDVAHWV